MVEKRTGKSIKCLRTDNGGELTTIEYEQYYKDEGIIRHKTVVYTPQQNGVAERMNQTLMERAKRMINNANLQKELWEEAVSTACYLVNISPLVVISCKIAKEVWTVKGYRLWDPTSRKIVISGDVTFDESSFLKSNVERIEQEQVSPNQQVQLEARPFDDSQKEEETFGEKGVENTKDAIEVSEPVQQPDTLRRSTRERKTPKRYEYSTSSFTLITEDGEPFCYQEAVDDTDNEKWKTVMEEEMDSLAKNNT
eukprot:PITA_22829